MRGSIAPRLVTYATRLLDGESRWRQAEYLRHVGSRRLAALVAKCRLGLLPVEMETGRWRKVARAERKCEHCGAPCGNARHLIAVCPAFGGSDGAETWQIVVGARRKAAGRQWRAAAREVEQRWIAKRRANGGETGQGWEAEDTDEEGGDEGRPAFAGASP